jgi:signal transduction histidine kinase
MRLSRFIEYAMEPVLQDWEDFARSIQPPHRDMDVTELRDHAEEVLREIVQAMDSHCPDTKSIEQSSGHAPVRDGNSAAEIHAVQRLRCGFTIDQLVAEYCALRASVIDRWARRSKTATWFEVEDMSLFNKALDEALGKSVARYSEMIRQAQDIFIGILGHDIRTPLNAISIGAETLMRSASQEGRSVQIASRIFNSSKRISGLVDNLLDFTSARFGMQLAVRPVDMAMLAEQVAEEIRSAHSGRTILLDVVGDCNGKWDSGRISQAISNLISNALQHGSQTEAVSVSLTGGTDKVQLTVHNLGTPIPVDEIGHIFQPLRRYSKIAHYRQGAYLNLGLGLYIAREVIVAHGGVVSVTSNETQGTTFTVDLPKQKAEGQGQGQA